MTARHRVLGMRARWRARPVGDTADRRAGAGGASVGHMAATASRIVAVTAPGSATLSVCDAPTFADGARAADITDAVLRSARRLLGEAARFGGSSGSRPNARNGAVPSSISRQSPGGDRLVLPWTRCGHRVLPSRLVAVSGGTNSHASSQHATGKAFAERRDAANRSDVGRHRNASPAHRSFAGASCRSSCGESSAFVGRNVLSSDR